MNKALRYLWQELQKHLGLFVILLVMVVLRLPNFLEPYWYGDEAIYLTIGNAINKGSLLYTDIVDHKTPLIYFLAAVPDQFSFRLLLTSWMVLTLSLYYCFSRKLLGKDTYALLATLFLMIFTTLPWFEGHIPNGELFVMGFVMMAAFYLRYTKTFQLATTIDPLLTQTKPPQPSQLLALLSDSKKGLAHESWLLLLSGMFLGMAVLTKVPAILDVGAFLALFWFIFLNVWSNHAPKTAIQLLPTLLCHLVIVVVGFFIPIGISILYFTAIGSGQDYLEYALLYNFHYSGTWKLTFDNPFITWLFTFGAKFLGLLGMVGLVSALTKKIPFRLQFSVTWFSLALFATLLSNRPYPHYFIQLLPALGLLFAMAAEGAVQLVQHSAQQSKLTRIGARKGLPAIIFAGLAFWITTWVLLTLKVGLYPVLKYYITSWLYSQNQISQTTYNNSFDALVNENAEVAQVIADLQLKELFIWGTNPMLYAQTKTIPTSRFTVAFHIRDVDDFEPTLSQIKLKQPKVIVVMKGEEQTFPALKEYLQKQYLVNYHYRHMTLYLRRLEPAQIETAQPIP